MSESQRPHRSLLLWGGIFGFGFGALLDVIVFHMIIQTHHLLSGLYDPMTYDGLRTNVMFDGLFALAMLGIMGIGAGMLWRMANRTRQPLSTLTVLGVTLVGMGVFNVYDGTIDHYVLDIHNVVYGTEAWNPPWIIVSLLLLGAGLVVLWFATRRDGSAGATREPTE